MKKFLFLTLLFGAITSTSLAQNAPDPAAMLQQAKEKQVPGLVDKVGLTAAQAEKLVEINFEMRMAASNLRDLSEADRAKRITELKAVKEKKISELLTPEQVKAVNAYYEDMQKNSQRKTNQ